MKISVVLLALTASFLLVTLCQGQGQVADLSMEDLKCLVQQHSALLQQQTTLLQRHEALIQQQDTKIQQLSAENQQQETKIQQLSAENQQQETKIQQLSAENQQQETKIQQLSKENQQQDTKIQQQGTKIQQQGTKIQQQGTKIQQLSEENQQQSQVIQHQSALLLEREAEMSGLLTESQQQQAQIKSLTDRMTIPNNNDARMTSRNVAERSDDYPTASDVLVIAQQQAASLQALQAQVQAFETKTARQVAFHASFTDGGNLDLTASQPIAFDHVPINLGNGYDPRTGMFTAPLSGLYAFFITMREGSGVSGWVGITIMTTPWVQICRTVVEGTSSHNMVLDKSSCFSPVHLNQGQQVHVQRTEGPGTAIEKAWLTNFSGFLLTADP